VAAADAATGEAHAWIEQLRRPADAIYLRRGRDRGLAPAVARRLMMKDACETHAATTVVGECSERLLDMMAGSRARSGVGCSRTD
jgi:hypothetical protein